AVARGSGRTGDGVTGTEVVLLDLCHGDVHVVRSGEVTRRPHERVVLLHVEDAGHRNQRAVVNWGRGLLVAGRGGTGRGTPAPRGVLVPLPARTRAGRDHDIRHAHELSFVEGRRSRPRR